MKKYLQILILFLFAPYTYSQTNWTAQATGLEFGSTTAQISFADANNVWILARDADYDTTKWFSRSSDGGLTWTPGRIDVPEVNTAMASLEAVSATKAYAALFSTSAGTTGGIWVTTDGGITWTKQTTALFNSASSFPGFVTFFDSMNGVCVGDPAGGYFEIYTTSDGGSQWTRVSSTNIPSLLSNEYCYTHHFKRLGNTVWYGTTRGRLFKSTDKGLTWTASQTPLNDFGGFFGDEGDYAFTDQNNGLIISNTHEIYKTTDGGSNWTSVTYQGALRNMSICHIPGVTNAYAVLGQDVNTGYLGTSFSLDGGLTWTLSDTLGGALNDISFASPSVGLAASTSTSPTTDGVWKYASTPVSVAENNFSNTLTVSPNPSNGIIKLEGENIVRANVYDLTGKLLITENYSSLNIAELNLEKFESGSFLVEVYSAKGDVSLTKIIKQ